MKSLVKLEPDVQRRRLYGFLARQGFSAALIGDVLKKVGRPASR
jgi:hypothetical protein